DDSPRWTLSIATSRGPGGNMSTRRRILVAIALTAASLLPARAEVSAVVDGFGTYVQTVVLSSPGRTPRPWTVLGRKMGYFPLNASGDLAGDRAPLVVESPKDRHPYVIWGHPSGTDVDLVWSQWTGTAWSPIAAVAAPSRSGDDHLGSMAFDVDARPYLSWWRNESGKGRVYLTIFLESIWMQEFAVSDYGVDSRNPVVTVLPDKTIEVDYDTPHGPESRIVTFDWPVSINDDITPMGRVSIRAPNDVQCKRH